MLFETQVYDLVLLFFRRLRRLLGVATTVVVNAVPVQEGGRVALQVKLLLRMQSLVTTFRLAGPARCVCVRCEALLQDWM